MATHITSRAERLNAIEQMLFRNPSGLRVVEIAAACNVDRRTIYRDLSGLMETGVPVYQKDGRFFLNQDYYLATLRLNLNEAVTIMLALRSLTHQQEQQSPHMISVLRKLGGIVPELPGQHIAQLVQSLWGSPIDRAYVNLLEILIRGWGERRLVKLWDGEIVSEFATYFIEPSPLGEIYVLGLDQVTQRIQAFRLRRIKRARLMKTPYLISAEFDYQQVLMSAWGMTETSKTATHEVLIALPADMIAGQQMLRGNLPLERLNDSRYLLRLHVTDWNMLLPWIRSWGVHAEVLAPQSLRDSLAADAAAMVATYARHS
ncbi:MAG: WYL domain-containing protein [Anaerolineae bacterium]|nr:WYL domain-containing protein [Anaerolineae bacterium]